MTVGLPQRAYGQTWVPVQEVALNGLGGRADLYPEINFFKMAPVCSRTDLTFYTTLKIKQPDKTYKLVPCYSDETPSKHPYYKISLRT